MACSKFWKFNFEGDYLLKYKKFFSINFLVNKIWKNFSTSTSYIQNKSLGACSKSNWPILSLLQLLRVYYTPFPTLVNQGSSCELLSRCGNCQILSNGHVWGRIFICTLGSWRRFQGWTKTNQLNLQTTLHVFSFLILGGIKIVELWICKVWPFIFKSKKLYQIHVNKIFIKCNKVHYHRYLTPRGEVL